MNSILVQLATLAVVTHMTLGCLWHHGFGTDGCRSEVHQAGHDHSGHEHAHCQHPQPADQPDSGTTDWLAGFNGTGIPVSHDHCQDDGCIATRVAEYQLPLAACVGLYLGGAENNSLARRGSQPASRYSHQKRLRRAIAEPLRAHLLVGKLLI